MKKEHPTIAIFVSFSGQGGVERIILTLAEGLASLGCAVDLLLVKARGLNAGDIPPAINVTRLNATHTFTSLPALVRYLRERRPDGLLAAKDRANQVALLAKSIARVPTRLVVRMGTTTSTALGQCRVAQKECLEPAHSSPLPAGRWDRGRLPWGGGRPGSHYAPSPGIALR